MNNHKDNNLNSPIYNIDYTTAHHGDSRNPNIDTVRTTQTIIEWETEALIAKSISQVNLMLAKFE